MKKIILTIVIATRCIVAQTNPTAVALPLSQDFGTTTFTTAPAGFAVWNGVSGGAVNSQALAEASVPTGNATIAAATASSTTGGAYGYASGGDAKLYIQTSSNGTNGVNQPIVALNTSTLQSIVFGYTVDSINASIRSVGILAQYRVGTSGTWTTISATSGSNPYSQAAGTTGLKTTVSATLPSVCDNQPVVQIRWALWRGSESGNSSGVAIDNVTATGTAMPLQSLSLSLSPATFAENAGASASTATVSLPAISATDTIIDLASSDTTEATVPASVTILAGNLSATFPVDAVNDIFLDGSQTAVISATNVSYIAATANATVTDDGDSPITVSISPSTIAENAGLAAATGTVTIPVAQGTDTTITLASNDTSEATVPVSVIITAGNTSTTFAVDAINDTNADGTRSVTISAVNATFTTGYTIISVTDDGDAPSPILVNQYYEGTSFDKYIELINTSNADVTLTGYHLTTWNTNAEAWKTNPGNSTTNVSLDSITIPANSTWLISGGSGANVPVNPPYAALNANNTLNAAVNGFNGNDSVVLYLGSSNAVENIIDAVSFTTAGNEGADKSFYRISTAQGYDLTAGSNITNFTTVWAERSLADVASAAPTDDWYLKYYTPPVAPSLDSFALADGAFTSAVNGVSIFYTSSQGSPTEFRVSEDPSFTGASWQPMTSFNTVQLSAGVGTKTVYFQLQNTYGTSSILSDDIDLETYTYDNSILITQYYSTSNNNKYIEITNTSAASVDVSNYNLVRWTNVDAEHWKYTGSVTSTNSPVISLAGLGTLAAGQTVVISHGSATTPLAAASANLTSAAFTFTGNDSIALYNGTVSPENLKDVISLTNAGNEALDKSFVRLTTAQGFDWSAGTSITSYSSIWQDTTLATVIASSVTQNEHLGTFPGGSSFATWATANNVTGTATDDQDQDCVPNGVEYFMGASPSAFTASPSIVAGTITWPKDATANATYAVKTSTDLQTWNTATTGVVDNGSSVVFTLPTGQTRYFVRLEVTIP